MISHKNLLFYKDQKQKWDRVHTKNIKIKSRVHLITDQPENQWNPIEVDR
jgi:hypothetical protein